MITFDFFGGFDILCISLDRANQSTDIWEVQLTANKVLEALKVIPQLSGWSSFQVMNFCLKCLKRSSYAYMRSRTHNYSTMPIRPLLNGNGFLLKQRLDLIFE